MGIKLVVNPLDGRLDASLSGADQASRVVLPFNIDPGASIGDIVYQDPLTANAVIVNTDNTQVKPSIGIVIAKPTPTTADVLVLGIYTGFTGLTIGDRIWLGTDGAATTTPPGEGYQQALGIAVAADTVFLMPNNTRVLKTP